MTEKKKRRLPDEHLAQAKIMVVKHRKKKKCNYCFDRGWIGVSEENTLIPCQRCVDQDKAFEEWKTYVKSIPSLYEQFKDTLAEGKEKKEDGKQSEEEKKKEAVREESKRFYEKL